LSRVLDDSVGKPGKLEVQRGGEVLESELAGQDLGSVAPDQFLELGEAGGRSVKLEVERGGEVLERDLPVQDLYSVTPDQFLEFGDGVVHNLSWQQARHINVPIKGVYIANPGYILGAAGVPRGAVVIEVGGKDIGSLADFERVL